MEQGPNGVEKGTAEEAESGDALQDILSQIDSEIIQGVAKGTQESASAASQLSKLADVQQKLVGQSKLQRVRR